MNDSLNAVDVLNCKMQPYIRRQIMISQQWVFCPVCGKKTRIKIRKDTRLINFPLYCPKCRNKSIINVNNQIITILKEPDAKIQRR